LSFGERLQEIRTGFDRPFWVANISELFERLSYYAAFASLARYLHETLSFPTEQAASLTGLFGGLVWFLAAFGGTLADRLGFRRSLSLAYFILSCSYFLLGSLGSPWLGPVRARGSCVDAAGFWDCAGEALRGGHYGAGFKGECPLDRLLDLLHAGEHRERRRAISSFVRSWALCRGECVSRRGRQCVSDVLCGVDIL
jgi:dipeptide/tripeptide permease